MGMAIHCVSLLAVGISSFLIARSLLAWWSGVSNNRNASREALLFLARLLVWWKEEDYLDMQSKMEMAGDAEQISAREFAGLKVAFGAGAALLFVLLVSLAQVPSSGAHRLLLTCGIACLGYWAPDLWIARKVKERRQLILLELPDFIDLLTLLAEAGLDFGTSIMTILENSKKTPLIEELSLFYAETNVGKSRIQALRDFGARVGLGELNLFLGSLLQSEKLGVDMAAYLRSQSNDFREKRIRRAERAALQAPIKMTVPLVFFIFPALILIMLGPVVISAIQSF